MDFGESGDLDVLRLAGMRDAGDPHAILDVREPWEFAICAIENSIHIPMRELPARLEEVPRDCLVVALCHHGIRSLQVTEWLRRSGFSNVVNLSAGIDAWAKQVDSSMATY
jgi:rhodanese-related sulfurtransferase